MTIHVRALALSLLFSLTAVAQEPAAGSDPFAFPSDRGRVPAAAGPEISVSDYGRLFDYSLALLTRPGVRKFLRETFKAELQISPELMRRYGLPATVKEMSETQFIGLLHLNRDAWPLIDAYLKEVPGFRDGDPRTVEAIKRWTVKFKELVSDQGIRQRFVELNDPTQPLPLVPDRGRPAYRDLKFHIDHPSILNGVARPPQSLKQVWINFIRGAKRKLVLNVFDFDLAEVAQELVAAGARGVEVQAGVDAGVVAARPEVAAVLRSLTRKRGVKAVAVSSVGLNHQKMAARDWDSAADGAVLFSSGNLTQSCSGPEGDLVGTPGASSPYSVPNANHLITMKSQLLALVVRHELQKTLELGLRGNQYPLGGCYTAQGLSTDGGPSQLYLCFSPHGGLGDLNRDVLARLIGGSTGPIRMLQFAFSSKVIEEALLARARKEGASFNFASVGDTPFSMAEWSVFLSMSGFARQKSPDGKTSRYVENPRSPWRQALGARFPAFQKSIRVAPEIYGTHSVDVGGGKTAAATGKIHHKVMLTGGYATVGTSYNFSEGALSNQEQLVIIKDPAVYREAQAMFEGLARASKSSVAETAARRNAYQDRDDTGDVADAESDRAIRAATTRRR